LPDLLFHRKCRKHRQNAFEFAEGTCAAIRSADTEAGMHDLDRAALTPPSMPSSASLA